MEQFQNQAEGSHLSSELPPRGAFEVPPKQPKKHGRLFAILVILIIVLAGAAGVGAYVGFFSAGGDEADPKTVIRKALAKTETLRSFAFDLDNEWSVTEEAEGLADDLPESVTEATFEFSMDGHMDFHDMENLNGSLSISVDVDGKEKKKDGGHFTLSAGGKMESLFTRDALYASLRSLRYETDNPEDVISQYVAAFSEPIVGRWIKFGREGEWEGEIERIEEALVAEEGEREATWKIFKDVFGDLNFIAEVDNHGVKREGGASAHHYTLHIDLEQFYKDLKMAAAQMEREGIITTEDRLSFDRESDRAIVAIREYKMDVPELEYIPIDVWIGRDDFHVYAIEISDILPESEEYDSLVFKNKISFSRHNEVFSPEIPADAVPFEEFIQELFGDLQAQ